MTRYNPERAGCFHKQRRVDEKNGLLGLPCLELVPSCISSSKLPPGQYLLPGGTQLRSSCHPLGPHHISPTSLKLLPCPPPCTLRFLKFAPLLETALFSFPQRPCPAQDRDRSPLPIVSGKERLGVKPWGPPWQEAGKGRHRSAKPGHRSCLVWSWSHQIFICFSYLLHYPIISWMLKPNTVLSLSLHQLIKCHNYLTPIFPVLQRRVSSWPRSPSWTWRVQDLRGASQPPLAALVTTEPDSRSPSMVGQGQSDARMPCVLHRSSAFLCSLLWQPSSLPGSLPLVCSLGDSG